MSEYRVVHCGTGLMGRRALHTLAEHPDLKLVGHYVSSPEKAGKDSGELVGMPANGVITTNSWGDLVDLKADALVYCADSVRREREAIEDVIPFLENGTNVVTVSAWELGHRATVPPDLLERIDAACAKGNSSCFFNSVDPGWATSDLMIAALAMANRIDSVRMIEFASFKAYEAEYASREYFGFGKPLDFSPALEREGIIEQMWAPTLHRIADVLEVPIDGFKTVFEMDGVDYDIEAAFGLVEAGTASIVHFELQALHKGRPFIVLEHVDYLPEDPSTWKMPCSKPSGEHAHYRVEVRGDPDFAIEMQSEHPSLWSVTPVTNCIPALIAAPPGLLGPLDVARYWSRNVTARLGPWP